MIVNDKYRGGDTRTLRESMSSSESIIKELGFMHFPFAQKLLHLTQDKKWGSKSFYINPGYKMAVYAEKM